MEAAASTVLNNLHNLPVATKLYTVPRRNLFPLSFSLTAPRALGLRSGGVRFNGPISCSSSNAHQSPSKQLALLFQVEGVLMDIYCFGNRQAFNAAFRKLGLDCASWTQPVYQDLVKKSFGDEERMLMLYFNRIGWPTSLPTTEKESFLKRVMREKKTALDDLVISKAIPLRPGVEDFIDDALEKSIPVVMLTACSKIGEEVARTIVGELGSHRVSKVKIIGEEEVKQSLYGQLVLSKGLSSDLGEQLAEEANKAVPAEEVSNTPSSQCFENMVAALQAGAEYAETAVKKCIVVAGSHSVVSAAERIGMVSVVVRSSLTARAEFAGAKAAMDGFGGSDLTVSMVRRMQNL
ncbi:hypothetical protein DM860_002110 [Cuscuta australis]|uniref:Haloacid dehalogenase-like hydrolase domain-containing protein n=1 Tax=Cuscuta australis TaxID=267555 RepID=A0A328DZP1_9ASTE|nr:hypothetical protein DM860_002110 [Cuscuta australis]